MFDPTRDTRHWLWALAEICGLITPSQDEEEESSPAVSIGTSIAEAWKATAEASELEEDQLASFVAYRFGLPLANLDQAKTDALELVPVSLAREWTIVPLRSENKKLVVATADPTAFEAEQDIRFVSGKFAAFEIAPPGQIALAIERLYGTSTHLQPTPEELIANSGEGIEHAIRVVEEDDGAIEVDAEDLESGPVVKLANLILNDAVTQRTTDVHIQPCSGMGVVRFRVDGVLRRYLELPQPVFLRVISRIKILGRMDISDRLRPQDGRARIEVAGRTYDLRMSTVPTRGAEKIVIRVLDPESASSLEDLGIPPRDLEALSRLLSQRNGIVPVTGPTGSGKTTTLYGALHRLSTPEVNVMTVEDPIEYELRGITQIQVETKRGLTFATALRSILRQDPDIVLVGEIRDRETAEIAVQASLTGHLVLSTLHTNDALGTIRRLTDLGLDTTAICETLRGAVAQRLARKLCPDCAETITGSLTQREEELARKFDVRPTRRAVGCDACNQQGYRGRMPIFQVFYMSPELEEAIRENRAPSTLRRIAMDQGMRSLVDSGRDRVIEGSTTLDEIERVVGDRLLSDRPVILSCSGGSVGSEGASCSAEGPSGSSGSCGDLPMAPRPASTPTATSPPPAPSPAASLWTERASEADSEAESEAA